MLRVSIPAPLFTTPPPPLIGPAQFALIPAPIFAPTLPPVTPSIKTIPVSENGLLIVELSSGINNGTESESTLTVEIVPLGRAPEV